MKPRPVWLIGDFRSAEFAAALERFNPHAPLVFHATIATALQFHLDQPKEEAGHPSVVVVAQGRPGEVAADDVERLHGAFPLSRLVLLLGAWCEGEMRTGRPIAGVTRVFWHAFANRAERLLADLESGRSAAWAFPRIAGEQQRLLEEIPAGTVAAAQDSAAALLIRAADLTTFETLADALQMAGGHFIWLDPRQWARFRSGSTIVWDAPRLDSAEWNLLAGCRAALPGTPIVLLAGFPRDADHRACQALGVAALLAKPYQLADLSAAVERAAGGHRQARLARHQMAG